MKKNDSKNVFWVSYSDLMTSLFFIMLVLFVVTVSLMHVRGRATEIELAKIKKIQKSIENIDSTYFSFDNGFQRHTLKNITANFATNSSKITDIDQETLARLEQAGQSIVRFMQNAKKNIPDAQYLLIIEGQSSKDNYVRNDELSYERSLALIKYWRSKDIVFDTLPCEVIISGSGQSSKFRVEPDVKGNRANQRFVIHIIPKPGVLDKE